MVFIIFPLLVTDIIILRFLDLFALCAFLDGVHQLRRGVHAHVGHDENVGQFLVKIIVRHGQSKSNLDKTFAGQLDSPLTKLGSEQAELAADYLKKYNFDIAYSSPLSRAYDTAVAILKESGLKIICNDSLKETALGDWEGISIDSVRDEYFRWRTQYDYAPPNGENTYQVRERAGKALDRIAKINDGKTVLITTHGGCIRLLPSYYNGNDDALISSTPIPSNVSITTVVYEKGIGRVEEYAFDEYLGEMKTVFDNGK